MMVLKESRKSGRKLPMNFEGRRRYREDEASAAGDDFSQQNSPQKIMTLMIAFHLPRWNSLYTFQCYYCCHCMAQAAETPMRPHAFGWGTFSFLYAAVEVKEQHVSVAGDCGSFARYAFCCGAFIKFRKFVIRTRTHGICERESSGGLRPSK